MKKKLLLAILLLGQCFSSRAVGSFVSDMTQLAMLTVTSTVAYVLGQVVTAYVLPQVEYYLHAPKFMAERPDKKFEHVVGAVQAKEALMQVVQIIDSSVSYHELGARMPKGILLEGPPGNGKTVLAKALAGETKVAFISTNGSEFTSKYYGEGVRKARQLFEHAKNNAPCIIFIDEMDGIGRRISSDEPSASELNRIINEILVQIDGMDNDPKKPVIVIGATNHRSLIDPALIRSGRFDTIVRVEYPDENDRTAILQLYAQKIKTDPAVDMSEFASCTKGFAGADLENLVNKAAMVAAQRRAKSVQEVDFEAALDQILTAKGLYRKKPGTFNLVQFGKAFLGHLVQTQTAIECD